MTENFFAFSRRTAECLCILYNYDRLYFRNLTEDNEKN